jgi:hypothetical protein
MAPRERKSFVGRIQDFWQTLTQDEEEDFDPEMRRYHAGCPCIYVSGFEGDHDKVLQQRLISAVAKWDGWGRRDSRDEWHGWRVNVSPSKLEIPANLELPLHETTNAPTTGSPSSAESAAHANLLKLGGHLMIWGSLGWDSVARTRVVRLRFATPDPIELEQSKLIEMTHRLCLKADFGTDEGNLLAHVAVSLAFVIFITTGRHKEHRHDALLAASGQLERRVQSLPRSIHSYNRGLILNSYALVEAEYQRDGGGFHRDAYDAYRNVLQEWTRAKCPSLWAATQANLGDALSRGGGSRWGTEFEEAVTAFELALQVWDRTNTPLLWVTTQYKLGKVLVELGQLKRSEVRIKEGIQALREALVDAMLNRELSDFRYRQYLMDWISLQVKHAEESLNDM